MIEDLKRILDATIGTLTPAKARELARSLAEGQPPEKIAAKAKEIFDRSRENAERVRSVIDDEIARQLHSRGMATRAELDALSKRVSVLEGGAKKASRQPAGKAAAKKAAPAKRPPLKRKAASAREVSED